MEKKRYTRAGITVETFYLGHKILAGSGGEGVNKYDMNVDGSDVDGNGDGGAVNGNPDEIDSKGNHGTWNLDW